MTSDSMKLVPLLLSQVRCGEDRGPLLMVLDPPKAQVVSSFGACKKGYGTSPLAAQGLLGLRVMVSALGGLSRS